ncbi:hypothetical protein KML24002_16020 [Alistipes putredinis]
MHLSPVQKISRKVRIRLFLSSYNGLALIVGILCFIHSILYHSLWINIEAPCQFMISLGIVFDTISLSVIASTIFYFITVYLPKQHKRKVEEYYIRKWLQQLEVYGKWILEDIGGNVNCSIEEFHEKACNIDLKSEPQSNISMREHTPIKTWFEYFENLFQWESVYIEQIVKYGDSVPAEIIVEFEQYRQFDNLRNAVYTYKKYYGSDKIYNTVSGFDHLAWKHAHSLMSLPEMYIRHIYD